MSDLNDFNRVNDDDDVMAEDVNKLIAASFRSEFKNIETLSATRTLLDVDTPIQSFDCDGADRIVKMPTANTVENHPFLIVNSTSSGSWTLTVQNNAGTETLAFLSPTEAVFLLPDGDGEYIPILADTEAKKETEYKITPTVASNDLTVTITHADGETPSTSRPLWFLINNTWRAVTAALYITLADGTNWCNAGSAELGTKEIDWFPMVSWVAADSAVAVGITRYPSGSVGGDFHATSTNEKYAAWKKGSNSAVTVASTDDVQVIGRFAATLSLSGTGYLWTVPTFTNENLKHAPVYETRELNWTPTPSRSSTGYTNAPTITYANYQIIGRRLFYSTTYAQHASPGGSGYQTVTLPFQAAQNASGTGFNLSDAYALAIFVASATLAGLRLFKYDGTAEAVASKTYGAWGNYRI